MIDNSNVENSEKPDQYVSFIKIWLFLGSYTDGQTDKHTYNYFSAYDSLLVYCDDPILISHGIFYPEINSMQ